MSAAGKVDGRRPRILDLFCCEGGASEGYRRAGFDVVGVDLDDRAAYPFPKLVGDVMDVGPDLLASGAFDAVHASPPCQSYTSFGRMWAGKGAHEYADLVGPVREMLHRSGLPFVLENVPNSPVRPEVRLCGSSFGLRVRRHRNFEVGGFYVLSPPCDHHGQGAPIGVYGNGGPRNPGGRGRRYKDRAEASEAMGGLPWMTVRGMCEAIPPAYTEYLGAALLEALPDVPDGHVRGQLAAFS